MTFAIVSYAAATVAYGLLAVLLALGRQSERHGIWLLTAVVGTSIWGGLILASAWLPEGSGSVVANAADALRGVLWTLCLLRALPDAGWQSTTRVLSASTVLFATVGIGLSIVSRASYGALAVLGTSVTSCLTIEQLFRNSTHEQQRVLKPFLWTIAAIFGYDLFVFSDAVLVNAIDTNLWSARGVIAALAAPFVLICAKRHPDWIKTLFISRKLVFYSTTLTGVGLYFIAMAIAGTLIRKGGGQWGGFVQLVFFVAALAVLMLALSSSRLRTAGRVFITKHFYRNRYEYRDEWLGLIRTLSASDRELPLDQRSIKALADIAGSPGGQLWLDKGAGKYEPFSAWGVEFPTVEYAGSAALVRFLKDQGWIIDSAEHDRDPGRYNHAFRDHPSEILPNSIIVPLFHRNELLGFARLVRSDEHTTLNYEDHDLLKTAGRQVAAFLAHDLAMAELAETRQFEAYNKLSAFVMHDVKNLLSQQALLVENAKKFQHRPEFVTDVVKTVDHGVQRMRRLLAQLERGAPAAHEQRVELNELVRDAVSSCSANGRVSPLFKGYRPLWVNAQPHRLASVVGHVITNAQDATTLGGSIEVTVSEQEGRALVEIRDNGEGMSEEFMRRRLFKPFDTTKGTSGMGIGVYQAREVVRSLGGDIVVKSTVGVGTTVSINLPLADPAADQYIGQRGLGR